MLFIDKSVSIPEEEIDFKAIRAQGAGGQKVNKTSCAIHLSFNIAASSLPDHFKSALFNTSDQRITSDGLIIIKAQKYRSLEKNRHDALTRLKQLILQATEVKKPRRPTKPSKNSQRKRMDRKTKHSQLKQNRKKIDY